MGVSASPRIVVTGPDHGWAARLFTAFAIRRAGGAAILSTPSAPFLRWEEADAVVLGGGADIDPARYRAAAASHVRLDPARDELEWAAIEQALARDLPILGICRGAQLLNVFLGGSLHQDLRNVFAGHSPRRQLFAIKHVKVEPNSRLHDALGCDALRVNSMHRQGVDRLGEGLVASARDRHGIVQGLERIAPPLVLGVQWHPEYLPGRRSQRRLFESIVRAAAA